MKTMLAFASVLLIVGCASQNAGTSTNAKTDVAQPQVTIEQLSSTPSVAEHVTGGRPVQYRMTITNTAQFPITLKQASIQSMGGGAYTVQPTSRPYNLILQPGETEALDFWVPANASDSVAGANGAVAVRLTTQYESSAGAFQHVTVAQVMGRIQ